MARWARRQSLERGAVVYAAWEAMWLVDARNRLAGGASNHPPALPAGLTADETAFLVELVAGRVPETVIEAIEGRYGRWDRSVPSATEDAAGDVAEFADARRRLRPPGGL